MYSRIIWNDTAHLWGSEYKSKTNVAIVTLTFIVLSVLFWKNAWVSEDAYINFRVVEQFHNGNGLVWNPGERVQVYTSPLWLLLTVAGRYISSNLFLNSIAVSYLLFIATCLVVWRLVRNIWAWLLCFSLMIASSTFFDYTTSGLEYPLIYFLLSIFFFYYFSATSDLADRKSQCGLVASFSLLLITRHDLLFLCFPPFAYCMWSVVQRMGLRAIIGPLLVLTAPFWLWSFFSLFYYGFLFPNTAYAKLGNGIGSWALFREGYRYLVDVTVGDSLTCAVITSAALLGLFSKDRKLLFVAIGIIFSVLYVLNVGGDYMRGRFLSPATFVAILAIGTLAGPLLQRKVMLFAWVATWIAYVLFYYHTPILSDFDQDTYSWQEWAEAWIESNTSIVDAREMHASVSSLGAYIGLDDKEDFPGGPYPIDAQKANASGEKVVVYGAIGMFGFLVYPHITIVDDMAISDPLLARLPASRPWRVGHYPRTLPIGYLESLESGENRILNSDLRDYYDRLKIVVRGEDLFSLERFQTIVMLNWGAYDHLLAKYIQSNPEIYGTPPKMVYEAFD